MDFFEKLIYDLVSLIAKMMDLVITVCKTLCGIPDASGNSQLLNLIQPSSTSGTVLICIFAGFCVVTGLIATVIAMVESFNVKATDGFSPQKPYIDVLKGILHMFLVAALFYVVVLLVGNFGTIFEEGMSAISNALGMSTSNTLGGRLLQNCFNSSGLNDANSTLWTNAWANGATPSWKVIKGIGDISTTFNAWQSIISVFVVAMPLFGILTYMAKRLVNIMLLFTIAPVAFSMYPLDDGHAKTEWYKDMKGALLGGVIMMLMLNLFLLISGVMFNSEKPLVPDPVMNGIAQAFILGAGVSMLISITKTVLKYLGCDDALLANMKSMSPMRSLKAIGRGVKSVGAKTKAKIQSKRAGGASPEKDSEGGDEREQLQRTTNRIAGNRKGNVPRVRVDRSVGGGSAPINGAKPPSGGLKISRYSTRDEFAKPPKVAPKPIEKPTAIPREKMIAKNGQVDNAKIKRTTSDKAKAESKKNKEVESFTKALDKFTKAILKLTKPTVKVDGKAKQPIKIERKREITKGGKPNAIAIKPTQIGDNKNKPVGGLPSRVIKPVSNVNTNISTTTNVRPTINGVSNKAGDFGLKQSIKHNEQMLRQNMDKLKKINTNIQAMPRKVTKNITITKKP